MSNTIEYAQKLGEIIKSNESSGFNEEEQFLENISSRRRRRANAFHVDSDFEDALDKAVVSAESGYNPYGIAVRPSKYEEYQQSRTLKTEETDSSCIGTKTDINLMKLEKTQAMKELALCF